MHRLILIAAFALAALSWGLAARAAPAPGAVLHDCTDCPAMVVIPPGHFQMGSLEGEPDRPETPIRTVQIDYAFAVAATPVTYGQYAAFIAATHHATAKGCAIIGEGTYSMAARADWRDPGYGRAPKADEPVVCVSWRDARAYADWLTQRTGAHYRLLTEAEWEYAAKAGAATRFAWGDNPDDACKYANLYDRSAVALKMPYAPANCSDGFEKVAPVGSFPPNAFGLSDMIGNVWQWVEDCYLYQYPAHPVDGTAVEVYSDCPLRAIRGGSWGTRVDRLRPSWRGRDAETTMNILFGFRVARDLR